MKSFLLCLFLVATCAGAQEAAAPNPAAPQASAPVTPPADPTDPAAKAPAATTTQQAPTEEQLIARLMIPESNALRMCGNQAYIDCLKIDADTCIEAIKKSVAGANAKMAEAAHGKVHTEMDYWFFQGQVLGGFMGQFMSNAKVSYPTYSSCQKYLRKG